MRFKTGFLIGLGAGYVLGTKAGRERYDQIVGAARAFMDNPGVQRLTGEVNKTVNLGKERVSGAASRRVEQVSSTLADQASKARSFVGGAEGKRAEGKEEGGNAGTSKPTKTDAGAPPATSTTRDGRSG